MKNQKGFSLIIVLLSLLVLAVVAFGGYYVWNQNNNEARKYSLSLFSVEVPESLVVNECFDEGIEALNINSSGSQTTINCNNRQDLVNSLHYDLLCTQDPDLANNLQTSDETVTIGNYTYSVNTSSYNSSRQSQTTHVLTFKNNETACAFAIIDRSDSISSQFSTDDYSEFTEIIKTVELN